MTEPKEIQPGDGQAWMTYRMADGSAVCGDYTFVKELDYFDDVSEPVEVVKETWVLQSRETVIMKPSWWDELASESD